MLGKEEIFVIIDTEHGDTQNKLYSNLANSKMKDKKISNS